jgi:hypothetical protein
MLAVGLHFVGGTLAAVRDREPETRYSRQAPCGKQRWDVKNLIDPAAVRVNLTPVLTTVDRLRGLARPRTISGRAPRTAPVEFKTYKVTAQLVEAKRAQSLEIVLIIRDRHSGHTMIVAFPDTGCSEVGRGDEAGDIHSAYDSFSAYCTPVLSTRGYTRLRGTAAITGVGYFDVRHPKPERGAAPNGIQLRPVLGFSSSNCRRP